MRNQLHRGEYRATQDLWCHVRDGPGGNGGEEVVEKRFPTGWSKTFGLPGRLLRKLHWSKVFDFLLVYAADSAMHPACSPMHPGLTSGICPYFFWGGMVRIPAILFI